MNIWRMVTHHINPQHLLEVYRNSSNIALGWGQVGDLRVLRPNSDSDIRKSIIDTYKETLPVQSAVSGGRCLWAFYHEMKIGDLVIMSVGKGPEGSVAEIKGDYKWISTPVDNDDYHHIRRVIWRYDLDGGNIWNKHVIASNWNPMWALIRLEKKNA